MSDTAGKTGLCVSYRLTGSSVGGGGGAVSGTAIRGRSGVRNRNSFKEQQPLSKKGNRDRAWCPEEL